MPALKPTCTARPCNLIDQTDTNTEPLELEAQADELEAEALRLRALAKRRRAAMTTAPTFTAPSTDLDERAAAAVVNTSLATFRRAKVAGDYFVGMRPRWRDAESVRAKFAARGKVATTPTANKPAARRDDVDVAESLSRAGLRSITGGAR